MNLPADGEANESRTKSLGVTRKLAISRETQETVSSLPQIKKRKKDKQPSLKRKIRYAQPTGEEHSFNSAQPKSQLKNRRTRKKITRQRKRAGLPSLPHFSDLAEDKGARVTEMSSSLKNDRAGPLAWNQGTTSTIRTSLRGKVAPAPDSKLGNNRLATGFVAAPPAAAPSPDSLESGETHSSPIEISSDEEEGGLLINVEGQATLDVVDVDSDSDDEDEEDDEDEGMEDGEEDDQAVVSTSVSSPVLGDRDAHMQLQGELERHLSNDFEPLSIDAAVRKKTFVRLADLSADELEIQYKYCFYGLKRDQIDLSRPAICNECLREGHTHSTCTEIHCTRCSDGYLHSSRHCPEYRRCTKCRKRGHDAATCQSKLKQAIVCDCCGSSHHVETECSVRFFPSIKAINKATIKLWISCCNCASKTHLVGDCPALHPDKAPRWSLRTLDAQQISNLSLQTGISGLEKAAENRNMRPQGRDIRPAMHQAPANQRRTFDDDSEDAQDTFLRPPIRRQNQKGNITFAHHPPDRFQSQRRSPEPRDRYDRYDAPSAPNNRSRGDWYQSDSFGQRRRSRSPEPGYNGRRDASDTYRPYDQSAVPRRPATTVSLEERIQYPQSGGYDRRAPGQERNWQPPLPAAPPPGEKYRPEERQPARPPKSTYQGQGQRQKKRGAYFH